MSESRVRSMTAIELVAAAEEAARRMMTVPDRVPEWMERGGDAPRSVTPMRYNTAVARVSAALFDDRLARVLYDDFWTLAAEVGEELARCAGGDLAKSVQATDCDNCGERHVIVCLVVRTALGVPARVHAGVHTAITCSALLACGFPEARDPQFSGRRGHPENLLALCALAWIRAVAVTGNLTVRVATPEEMARELNGDDEQ